MYGLPDELGVELVETDLLRLGRDLEAARLTAGLSAREVADMAGLSPVYLRALERGNNPKTGKPSRPSAEALINICRALGTPPEPMLELAGYDPEQAHSSAQGTSAAAPSRRAIESMLRELQDASRHLNLRSPFMHARVMESLEQFTADYKAMTLGVLRCDAKDEPHLTRLAIAGCRAHLRAISYQDEPWWLSESGDVYLELHQQRKEEDGVEMTRIFLVDPQKLPELRPTLQRHLDLGIKTYVLDPQQVDPGYWRDVVIYDDVLLRTADETAIASDQKRAEFTDEPGRVGQARQEFEDLRRVAENALASAERVLERLDRQQKPA